MINTKFLIDLDDKLNNIKTSSKKEVFKKDTEVKSDFKDYLNKEVKGDTSKSLTEDTYVQENNKASIAKEEVSKSQNKVEDILTEVSNKLDDLINDEDFLGSESDIDALSEILILLSSLLNKDLSNDDLININPDFSSLDNNEFSNVEDLFLTLFNGKEEIKTDNSLSDLKILNTHGIDDLEIKDLLKDIKGLNDNILENIYLDDLDTNAMDNYKNELSNKILSLLESLPKEAVDKLSSKIGDEDNFKILVTLLNKESNKVNSIDEKVSNTKVIVNDKFVDTKVTSIDKEISNKNNLNDDSASKKNISYENNDEDKILSKIIDGDGKNSFSKILNYYDKLNKNNMEVIKEPVVVNKQTLDLDIIKNVKFMMKNAVQELKVKIYPKELGEMTIKILSEEGIMRAEIKATSKETYNLLNSNLHEIKKSLVDQNIKIQEVNIGIYNEDTTFFSGKENSSDSFRNQQSSESNNKSVFIDDEEDKEDLLNESNVNLLA